MVAASSAAALVAGSWRMDVSLPVFPPKRVIVHNAIHGTCAVADIPPSMTVAELKHELYERLLLRPNQRIRLVSWGRELDDSAPLTEYSLQNDARIEMQLSLCRPEPLEPRRVRVWNSALKTRQYVVEAGATVGEMKKRIESAMLKGDHEWHAADGTCTRARGATVLAACNVKPDEKAGTVGMSQGLELVVEGPFDPAKKGAVKARKATNGREVLVPSEHLLPLELPAAKQKLLFDGRTLSDDETLTELRAGPEGASRLYHDGELVLEFESPAMPEILRKIRSGEVKVGGAKSKGKGGKGGGKGKKGKKKK